MIKRLALIILLQKCCIASFCQLTSADTQLIEGLYLEILEENEKGNFEQAMFKSDSLVAFCERKRDWYYAYAGGIAVKINLATVNNKIDILYENIQLLDNKIEEHFDELGEYAESMRFDNRLRLGMYYIKRGNMNRAQEVLENLLSEEELKKNNYPEMPNLLMSLSKIHKFHGNYLQALNYIQECKNAFFTLKTPYPFGYEPLIYKHIADLNALIGNEKLAEENYNKSIDLYNTVKHPSKILLNGVVNSYNAYAQFNLNRSYTDKAIFILDKSLDLQEKSVANTEETYRLLAEAHIVSQEYDKAEELFKKSISQNKYDSKNYPLARTHKSMADMYIKQDKLPIALEYYQKALTNLQDDFDSLNFCDNPTDFANVLGKKDLIKVFHQKAITLLKVSKKEPDYLPCSWQTIQLAIDLLDNIKLDNTSDADKQLLLEESYSIFEDAIKISLAQASEEGNQYAFKVAEKSKSSLLLSAVRNTQIRNFYIPDSLIDLEQQYKFELQTQLEKNYENRQSGSLENQISDEILAAQKKLNQLTTYIKKEYPKYFELRYNTAVVSGGEIREKLASDKVFVEYFIGQEKSYIFLIQKDVPLEVFTIDIAETELKTVVQEFLYSIYLPHITTYDKVTDSLKAIYPKPYADKVYAERAHQLYELLLEPAINALSNNQQQLEIIPDGILNYLPFDALIQKRVAPEMLGYYENESDYQYVGRDFQTSYCYSATLMDLMSNSDKIEQTDKDGFLVFHDEDFTAQTVSIQSIFQRYSFFEPFVNVLHEKANKESLKQQSEKYKYLHFSVHGVINNKRPAQSYLKLRTNSDGDSLLYLRDIYSMSFPSEMVFTSACNAGVGPLSKGEGLLSLARGFAYSGARSLITTLWTVKGGASNQLLTEFYKNISRGATKDEALFLAKKTNLNTAAYAHPYYWAGFIPIGNMEAIAMPLSIWNLVGGVTLLLVSLLIFRRFKKVN